MLDKLKKELDIVTADRDAYREIVFKENERDALKRELAEKQKYILELEAELKDCQNTIGLLINAVNNLSDEVLEWEKKLKEYANE